MDPIASHAHGDTIRSELLPDLATPLMDYAPTTAFSRSARPNSSFGARGLGLLQSGVAASPGGRRANT